MLIITGTLRVRPEARDGILRDAHRVMTLARRAPGCHGFVMAPDPLEDDRIVVVERWDSEDELLAFRGSGPSDDQRAELLEIDVHRYEVAGPDAP